MVATHELQIEAHKLVALSFNPDKSGSPIILLHGICSSVYYWTQDLIELFTQHGPCYALSLPGHYPAIFSPQFKQNELTAETLARLLGRAIRQLVGQRAVILVGHSTGGFAALNIAAHVPEMVGGIISIAGFAQGQWIGVLGRSQTLARRGWFGNLLFRLSLKLNLRVRIMHRAFLRFFTANHQSFFANPYIENSIDHYLPYAQQLDLTAMKNYFAIMPEIDISPLLSRITAPTLVLTGDSDPIVPPVQSRLIAEKVPHADLVLLKGTGHLPFFETPTEYQHVVNHWLYQQVRQVRAA